MDSPNEVMYHVHWLPVQQRIHHKIVRLTFKCLSGEAPQYLRDMVVLHYQNRPGLHSNNMYKDYKNIGHLGRHLLIDHSRPQHLDYGIDSLMMSNLV